MQGSLIIPFGLQILVMWLRFRYDQLYLACICFTVNFVEGVCTKQVHKECLMWKIDPG